MSLSAGLILAAAAAASASVQGAPPPRRVELAQARVEATILPAVIVRQSEGPVKGGEQAPRHQVSRRGNTVLIEYQ